MSSTQFARPGNSSSRLSLFRLRNEGSLSNTEFGLLSEKITATTVGPLRKAGDDSEADKRLQINIRIDRCCGGRVVVDHIKGPIFPDEVYCLFGAGSSMMVAGRIEANSWSANMDAAPIGLNAQRVGFIIPRRSLYPRDAMGFN
jgi:hypothetical protein